MAAYWRLFYHLVWATRDRLPLIGEPEEEVIRRSLALTCDDLDLIPHAVGVMPEHLHMVVSIPPKVAVAEAVRRLKGASANAVNHRSDVERGAEFRWQGGYGALSFGEQALPRVVAYAEGQHEHHARGALWEGLERCEAEPGDDDA